MEKLLLEVVRKFNGTAFFCRKFEVLNIFNKSFGKGYSKRCNVFVTEG